MAARDNAHLLLLTHVFPRTLDDSMGAFLLHLAEALAECGWSTDVVAPHAPGLADAEVIGMARVRRFHYAPARWETLAYHGTMHELVAGGLPAKLLFAALNLAFLGHAFRVLRAARPRILHAHWWLPGGLAGALVAAATRTPLVVTTHGTDVEMLRRTRWARPLARFVFGRARAVTCGSTYLREQLLACGVVEAGRVRVIPMPVNPVFESRGVTNADRNPRKVLAVARLSAQKSIDTLVEAMARLRARGTEASLTIIGEGTERAALQAQVERLGLQGRVEFAGARPQAELPRAYSECSLFVLPSIREGMGLVLAEALLCGAPVIATNSGGVTDIVRDGETGLLVPERDPAALAAAMDRLLNDRALAERLAANGRAWVREGYTRGRIAEQFVQVYREAAG